MRWYDPVPLLLCVAVIVAAMYAMPLLFEWWEVPQ